jgi:hypothetical protein
MSASKSQKTEGARGGRAVVEFKCEPGEGSIVELDGAYFRISLDVVINGARAKACLKAVDVAPGTYGTPVTLVRWGW